MDWLKINSGKILMPGANEIRPIDDRKVQRISGFSKT